MAKYFVLGRYNAQGAAAVVKEGYVARSEAVRAAFESVGATQLGWWVIGNGEWDFAIMLETDLDQAALAAMLLRTNASGAFERASVLPLSEPAAADAFLQRGFTYRPPGA